MSDQPEREDRPVPAPQIGLEWERSDGVPVGVGICLSGGGIRAAMFSLGALQVLQERRGLLFGPRAARVLSAVSGGSYIASAYISNAASLVAGGRDLESTPAPFALGSLEEQHVLSRGKYLLTPRGARIAQLSAAVLAGPLALFSLLIWAGFILADGAIVLVRAAPRTGLPIWFQHWPWWVSVPLTVMGLILLGRQLFDALSLKSASIGVGGLALVMAALPAAVVSLEALGWPTTLAGWACPILLASLGVALSAAIAFAALRAGIESPLFGRLERLTVAVLMLVTLGAAMMFMVPFVAEIFLTPDSEMPPPAAVAWMIGGIVAPVSFALVLRRVSLHQFYREALRSSFGVLREGKGALVPGEQRRLSDLNVGAAVPRLLISATANCYSDRHTFDAFVFSHDQCGIPGTEMWHHTAKLELALSDGYGNSKPESTVTLPTSVAATGAALSASMGRYTRPSTRLVLAMLNIRLGRTIPSVGREHRRQAVARLESPARIRTRTAVLPGLDDLVAELFGVAGPNMYVSDGGHFDNLGLITLLRARCQTIWCVDASPRPLGDCPDLVHAINLARDRLDIDEIDIDTNAFRTTTRGVFPVTHVSGTVRFEDGETSDLHVIKLGLHFENLEEFARYRQLDRKFPHHSTLNQLYSTARMEKYRDLGRDNARRCLNAL